MEIGSDQVAPNKYGYGFWEMAAMSVITALTNFAVVPVIVMFHKQRMVYHMFIALFTLLGSFMYHFLDSIQVEQVFLNEGQWHRLDNIGSVVCFQMLFIYLADLQNLTLEYQLNYTALIIAILAQEKDPWNINYTIVPIVLIAVTVIAIKIRERKFPQYNSEKVRIGLVFMILAFYCFYHGLDDFRDYLRFYHGMWHTFVAIFSFYMWQCKLREGESYTLKNVWFKPQIKYGYYWPFDTLK